jgi:hypothetical protein
MKTVLRRYCIWLQNWYRLLKNKVICYSFKAQYAESPHPQIIGPTGQTPWNDYWTDFESENGFDKVLQ